MELEIPPVRRRLSASTLEPMAAPQGPPILTLMIVSILLLGAVALWDERRESAAALDDFAAEQSSLAREAGSALASRLASLPGRPPEEIPVKPCGGAGGNTSRGTIFTACEASLLATLGARPPGWPARR